MPFRHSSDPGGAGGSAQPLGTTSKSLRSRPFRTARARYSSFAKTTSFAAEKLRRSIAFAVFRSGRSRWVSGNF